MTYNQPQPDVFSTLNSSENCIVVSDSFVFTANVLQVVHPETASFFTHKCTGHLYLRDVVLLELTDVFFMNANDEYSRPTDREVDGEPLSRYAMIEGTNLSFLTADANAGDAIQEGFWVPPVQIKYVFEM